MGRNASLLALCLLALCLPQSVSAQTASTSSIHVVTRADWAGQPKYRPDELLVRFRPGIELQTTESIHSALQARVVKSWPSVEGLQLVQLATGANLQSTLAAYRQNPSVLYAEPNYVVHAFEVSNDPLLPEQWDLQNTGQNGGTTGADIHVTQAWTQTTGSSNVVVAVIDTGIDYTHPDLAANVWSSPSGYSGALNGVGIDCAAGTHGLNVVGGNCDPLDDNGHGSHVSGTIGAVGNNDVGVVGVNWTVQIMTCKFLDSTGAGTVSDAVTCLDFVKAMKDQGVNIVATNNSWGGGDFSQALADAIQTQEKDGILFIAAAGNDFESNDFIPQYPASYFLPNVISVAASDRFDNLAYFSDVGLHSVHLGAPGQEILSTTPNDTYTVLSGTSMAAPHVTGVAALLSAFNSKLDWRAIKNLILAGGDTDSSLGATVTGKRLNAYGSMSCSNSTVTNRLQPTLDSVTGTAGQPITLAVLNINCAQPLGTVNVSVSPGGQTIVLVDDGTGADQAAGDGIYTAQWTPPGPGNFTLIFPTGNPVQVTVLNNYGVGLADPTYVTISGTNLNLGDDDVATIASPFPVQFGGGAFTNLYVSSNGTISFTNAFDGYLNISLPMGSSEFGPATQELAVQTLVAPFWEDLFPVHGSDQNVFWGVVGTAPNRELVVEWRNVRTYDCHDDANATVTFEVVFSESSSNFQFNYSNAVFGDACALQDFGNRATVGEQTTQNIGTQWSYDQMAIADGTSLLWSSPPASVPTNPIPTITSISPTVIPFGAGPTVVSINGAGFVPESTLVGGPVPMVYQSSSLLQITVPSASPNDPRGGPFQIQVSNPAPGGGTSGSVTLTVTGAAPQITSISPASVPAGSFGFVLTLNVTNFIDGSDVAFNQSGGGTPDVLSPTQITIGVPGPMLTSPTTYDVQLNYPTSAGYTYSNSVPLTVTPATTPASTTQPTSTTQAQPASSTQPASQPTGGAGGGSASTAVLTVPQRFLGWKYADNFGPAYSARFKRPRANVVPSEATSEGTSRHVSAQTQESSSAPSVPGFDFRSYLPADFLPAAVVTGDFNGDGKMDWAVANAGSNSIWIYLGKGDGTAQLPTIISLRGLAPVALAVADMNHDGKLDLVVGEADSGMVAVLLGNGDGTFEPELQFAAPGAPVSLAVADFNGDGNPGVVAGLLGVATSQLAFFAGDGTGKLDDPITHQDFYLPATFYTDTIVAADLNGDGLPDLVTVDYSTGVRAYVNQGDGTFKLSQQVFVDNAPVGSFTAATSVALGDVNKDGCVDAVTVDTTGNATFFPGQCDGTFDISNTRVFGTGIMPGTVVLSDVNDDGNLDLISSGMNLDGYRDIGDTNSISVQFGDGTGNFSSPKLYRGKTGMFSLAVADLNGDGFPEVVTANQDSDTVTVYLNDGSGFGAPGGNYIGYVTTGQINPVTNAQSPNFALIDVNGDGHKDLVTFEIGEQYPLPNVVTVLLGDGTGNFSAPIRSQMGGSISNFALADFRNLGLPDLLMIAGDQISYAKNNGDGTFQRPTVTLVNNEVLSLFVTGDFNGDGKLDAVAAGIFDGPNGAQVSLVPMLGQGDGTFAQNTPILLGAVLSPGSNIVIKSLFAGDFNHDGKLDLLVGGTGLINASDQEALYELLGNGDGTFQAPILLFNNFGINFTLADLNGDGLPDIVAATAGPQLPTTEFPWTYHIYLGNPDGTFSAGASYGPFPAGFLEYMGEFFDFDIFTGGVNDPINPIQPFVADFNGDGIPDLAIFENGNPSLFNANGNSGSALVSSMQIFVGNGDGTFTPLGYGFNFDRTMVPQLAADVNEDGRADLVETNQYTSSYNILLATTGAAFAVGLDADPVIGAQGKLHIALAYPSASGTTVQLSASDPAIAISPTVSFPSGSASQDVQFQIGNNFNAMHVFAITARLGAESHTAYGTSASSALETGFEAAITMTGTPVILPSQSTPDFGLLVASTGGYATTIQLSCQGLPATAACQFGQNPVPVTPGSEDYITLMVATQATILPGSYPFTVVLTDGEVTTTVSATFNVGDFSISIEPQSQTMGTTDGTSFTLTLQGLYGYSLAIQTTCGTLPTGVACPQGLVGLHPPNGQVFLSVSSQNAPEGSYTFTVIGTAGIVMHSASAQLVITGGTFSGSVSSASATISVGSTQNVNIQVNSTGGFQGQVALSCTALEGISCQFAPPQVSVTSAQPGTSVLTLSVTSKPSMIPPAEDKSRRAPPALAPALSVLAILFWALLSSLRLDQNLKKRRRIAVARGVFLAALLLSSSLTSCGGGTGGSAGGGNGGSTPFTSQVLIQGTVGTTTITLGTISVTVP